MVSTTMKAPTRLASGAAEKRALLTKIENLLVGSFGSIVGSLIQMPAISWKISAQRGTPMPDTLAGLYRGLGIRLMAVIPLNATTMIVNGALEKAFGGTETKPLTRFQKMLCAIIAGCSSCPIQSIMDTTMIHQQRLELGMLATWGVLLKEHRLHALTHGLIPTAVREAVGAVGFLLLTPIFAELVAKKLKLGGSSFVSKIATAFAGSFPTGIICSGLTMSLDAAKTKSVVDMARKVYWSTWHAIYKIFKQEGFLALYKGFPQRTLVVGINMFVLPVFRELAISYKTRKLYG